MRCVYALDPKKDSIIAGIALVNIGSAELRPIRFDG
jgi:hypothetical protein